MKKPNWKFSLKLCSGNQSVITGVCILTRLLLPWELCFFDFDKDELPGGMTPIWRTIVPYWKDAIGLGSIVFHTKSKAKQWRQQPIHLIKPFINKRKPSNTTVSKGNFNNGEHTLIRVTAKMIHSAVSKCQRLVLKDDWPVHMVKFVGAVRNFSVNTKCVKINVKDGTGLVRVILWRKEKKCKAQHQLIHKCNSNCYIRVIGEVEDYYGVHKINAFNVWPVSSGTKVTHHFLEAAYSLENMLEYAEDEMLRAVLLE
jgi:hypothetical protein